MHATQASANTLESILAAYRDRANQALLAQLPDIQAAPQRLHQAMHYAVTVGGKRVRPILVYATGAALGVEKTSLDTIAVAVELIHAYSLVHDDLPAMDDDDLRRGQPTCHIKFDEATAILAGDALQALAYDVLSRDPQLQVSDGVRLRMLQSLTHASGSTGMAGGQAIDLDAVGKPLSLDELETMHRCKTGALIRASVQLAALCQANTSASLLTQLDHYAAAVGLAFQIVDDILDVTTDTATLGKQQGADQALNKPTYPALLGLDGARQHAQQTYQQALDALHELGPEFDILRNIATYIVQRSY